MRALSLERSSFESHIYCTQDLLNKKYSCNKLFEVYKLILTIILKDGIINT